MGPTMSRILPNERKYLDISDIVTEWKQLGAEVSLVARLNAIVVNDLVRILSDAGCMPSLPPTSSGASPRQLAATNPNVKPKCESTPKQFASSEVLAGDSLSSHSRLTPKVPSSPQPSTTSPRARQNL